MLADFSGFSNEQIVMVTYLPVDEVKKFVKDFNLSSHSNIKVGTENNFLVRNYYNVEHFPFVVLYDKSGKEQKIFANRPSVKDIVKVIKKQ